MAHFGRMMRIRDARWGTAHAELFCRFTTWLSNSAIESLPLGNFSFCRNFVAIATFACCRDTAFYAAPKIKYRRRKYLSIDRDQSISTRRHGGNRPVPSNPINCLASISELLPLTNSRVTSQQYCKIQLVGSSLACVSCPLCVITSPMLMQTVLRLPSKVSGAMDISLQFEPIATQLSFNVIGTYLAAVTAVIGILALANTVLRQRRRTVSTDTYELDATPM